MTQRPRILINVLSLSQGGGRSYASNVLRELGRDPRGFEISLLALPTALEGLETEGLGVLTAHPIPTSHALKGVARQLYEQTVLPLRAWDFDLLYCVADIAPIFGGRRQIMQCQNLNIYDRRWYDNPRTRTLARLAGLSMRRARRVIFPSRAAADRISELAPVPRDRIRVVHHGVSVGNFASDVPEETTSDYLFLPAAPERHKNIELLIRSLPLLRNSSTEAWIAGESLQDFNHRGRLEALARSVGVARRVRFLGAIPHHELPAYYRAARALVFPSFIETFGYPVVEAMAAGTPVLASDISTFHEMAGDAALYFPVDAPDALARCVDALDDDPRAREDRVALGRERAGRFDWGRSVDALCAVFEEGLA